MPETQPASGGHWRPHAPQLSGSERVETQPAPQQLPTPASPVWHGQPPVIVEHVASAQLPPEHTSPTAHSRPH